MNAQHTPGPWTIEEYGDDEAPALVIHKDSESRVCFMATPGSHGDPARIEADAHLIAAAPDLLAAATEAYEHAGLHTADCERVTTYEEGAIFEDFTGCTCFLSRLRAAIGKATGEPLSSTQRQGE